MKRIISFTLMVTMLLVNFAYAETRDFNLDVFFNQMSISDEHTNQYTVIVDDMEARGFIKLKDKEFDPRAEDYRDDVDGLGDGFLYICEPDIILASYGTPEFIPMPRIWFRYYGDYAYLYDTVIFKIGDTTYTFNNCALPSSLQVSNWSSTTNFESQTLCLCYSDYIPFMDAWIANGTDPIKVRLKDDLSGRDSYDFIYPSVPQADILLMFQNFKDAGGYDLLPALE